MSKKNFITAADITRANDKLIERSSNSKLTGATVSRECWVKRDAMTGRFTDVKIPYDAERGETLWKKVIESHVTKKS